MLLDIIKREKGELYKNWRIFSECFSELFEKPLSITLHLCDVSSLLLTCDTPEPDDSARLLWVLATTIPPATLGLCWPVNMSMDDSVYREGSWLVFRIPLGCCIRLCWSLDDIPANYRLLTSPSPKSNLEKGLLLLYPGFFNFQF